MPIRKNAVTGLRRFLLSGSSQSGITGNKTTAGKGLNDFWVMGLDTNGNRLWEKTLGGSADDLLYDLQLTADGSFILGGSSNSPVSGDKSAPNKDTFSDYWIVKITPNAILGNSEPTAEPGFSVLEMP